MTRTIPRSAWMRGRGRVRVIDTDGDYFTILTRHDERVRVHRSRLVFTRGR